jgi:hypothetical protein
MQVGSTAQHPDNDGKHRRLTLPGHRRNELQRRTRAMTSRQWRLAVVAELVLRAVLGSLFLGTHSFFFDESSSWMEVTEEVRQ